MREIELTQGYKALVDDEDYEFISQWKWCVLKTDCNVYAKRTSKAILMHREIIKFSNPGIFFIEVDHKNHIGLDNQKNNLRICTRTQNMGNQRKRKNVSSKYKGVHWESWSGKWRPCFPNGSGGSIKGPRFKDDKLAAQWYNKKAKEYFGEFALLNDI